MLTLSQGRGVGIWGVADSVSGAENRLKSAFGTGEDAGGEPTAARVGTLKARSDAMINSIPPFLLSQ